MASALEQLAASPYCPFIEKVFVIGEWKETCRIYVKQAKLSSNDAGGFAAGGEAPPPSPERQATIEAPSLSFSSDDLCSICLDRGEP